MLLSILLLNKYNERENFSNDEELTNGDKGCKNMILVMILLIEISLTVWALLLALNCSSKNQIFHVTFAALLPFWYLLLYYWGDNWCPNRKDPIQF